MIDIEGRYRIQIDIGSDLDIIDLNTFGSIIFTEFSGGEPPHMQLKFQSSDQDIMSQNLEGEKVVIRIDTGSNLEVFEYSVMIPSVSTISLSSYEVTLSSTLDVEDYFQKDRVRTITGDSISAITSIMSPSSVDSNVSVSQDSMDWKQFGMTDRSMITMISSRYYNGDNSTLLFSMLRDGSMRLRDSKTLAASTPSERLLTKEQEGQAGIIVAKEYAYFPSDYTAGILAGYGKSISGYDLESNSLTSSEISSLPSSLLAGTINTKSPVRTTSSPDLLSTSITSANTHANWDLSKIQNSMKQAHLSSSQLEVVSENDNDIKVLDIVQFIESNPIPTSTEPHNSLVTGNYIVAKKTTTISRFGVSTSMVLNRDSSFSK